MMRHIFLLMRVVIFLEIFLIDTMRTHQNLHIFSDNFGFEPFPVKTKKSINDFNINLSPISISISFMDDKQKEK